MRDDGEILGVRELKVGLEGARSTVEVFDRLSSSWKDSGGSGIEVRELLSKKNRLNEKGKIMAKAVYKTMISDEGVVGTLSNIEKLHLEVKERSEKSETYIQSLIKKRSEVGGEEYEQLGALIGLEKRKAVKEKVFFRKLAQSVEMQTRLNQNEGVKQEVVRDVETEKGWGKLVKDFRKDGKGWRNNEKFLVNAVSSKVGAMRNKVARELLAAIDANPSHLLTDMGEEEVMHWIRVTEIDMLLASYSGVQGDGLAEMVESVYKVKELDGGRKSTWEFKKRLFELYEENGKVVRVSPDDLSKVMEDSERRKSSRWNRFGRMAASWTLAGLAVVGTLFGASRTVSATEMSQQRVGETNGRAGVLEAESSYGDYARHKGLVIDYSGLIVDEEKHYTYTPETEIVDVPESVKDQCMEANSDGVWVYNTESVDSKLCRKYFPLGQMIVEDEELKANYESVMGKNIDFSKEWQYFLGRESVFVFQQKGNTCALTTLASIIADLKGEKIHPWLLSNMMYNPNRSHSVINDGKNDFLIDNLNITFEDRGVIERDYGVTYDQVMLGSDILGLNNDTDEALAEYIKNNLEESRFKIIEYYKSELEKGSLPTVALRVRYDEKQGEGGHVMRVLGVVDQRGKTFLTVLETNNYDGRGWNLFSEPMRKVTEHVFLLSLDEKFVPLFYNAQVSFREFNQKDFAITDRKFRVEGEVQIVKEGSDASFVEMRRKDNVENVQSSILPITLTVNNNFLVQQAVSHSPNKNTKSRLTKTEGEDY